MADRFVSPAPPPDAHQREAAEILIEECAEIIEECSKIQKRATKLLRFGVAEIQPGQPDDNAHRLGMEVGDLLETIELAISAGIISPESIAAGRANKRRQLAKFVQTKVNYG